VRFLNLVVDSALVTATAAQVMTYLMQSSANLSLWPMLLDDVGWSLCSPGYRFSAVQALQPMAMMGDGDMGGMGAVAVSHQVGYGKSD